MARSKSRLQATLGGTPDDVEAAFYEGMQTGDVDKVMACWADEDEVACIHPGGSRLLGLAAIRASFENMLSDGAVIPVRPENIHRTSAVASAVHHVIERVDALQEGIEVDAYVLATNVYHKTAQGWRMVVHHASPGAMQQMHEVSPASAILH